MPLRIGPQLPDGFHAAVWKQRPGSSLEAGELAEQTGRWRSVRGDRDKVLVHDVRQFARTRSTAAGYDIPDVRNVFVHGNGDAFRGWMGGLTACLSARAGRDRGTSGDDEREEKDRFEDSAHG